MTDDRPGFLPRFRRRINAGGPAVLIPAVAGAGAVATLFLLVLLFCLTRVTDSDLFWHLATGDLIRRTGHVPRTEPFSFTAYGLPWIDVHWLYQVGVSYLKEAGGFGAVTAATALLVTSLFAFLYRRGRRLVGIPGVVATLLLATLACQERFLTRPETVSWWLLAATLVGLEAALEAPTADRRRMVLWLALPLLQIVWVNVQVLFVLGPAMAGLALLSTAARALRRPARAWEGEQAPAAQSVDLLGCLAIESLASLLNPCGAATLRLPFEHLRDHLGGASLLSRTIAEFQPTLLARPTTAAIVAFAVFALAVISALALNAARVALFDLLVSGATLYLALRARRNIPIFVVVSVPILLRNAAQAFQRLGAARSERGAGAGSGPGGGPENLAARVAGHSALIAASLLLCADVVSNRFFLRPPTERWWGVGTIPYYFPEEAARFVASARLPGQVFHPLEVGGYLIKIWDGDRRVFIDGRNDPYRHGVLETYLSATADPAAFEAAASKYQITMVLWTHRRALEGKALLAHLAEGHGWSLVHLDPAAAVYARSELIKPGLARIEPLPPGQQPGSVYVRLQEELDARPFSGPPIREIALAHYFSASGDPAGAEFFLGRALDRVKGNASLWHDFGLALERQGRTGEAREAYRASLAIDPGFSASEGALGAMALSEGDLEQAERRLDVAYRRGERGSQVLTARARLFERQGKGRDAANAWGEAILSAPGRREVLLEAARFHVRRQEPDPALALYTRLLAADPGDSVAAAEKALLLESLGRPADSLETLRAAGPLAQARLSAAPNAGADPRSGRTVAGAEEGSGLSRADDLRLLEVAARLEEISGDRDRAGRWRRALQEAGER